MTAWFNRMMHGGVIDVSDLDARAEIMTRFPVTDLWGVGPKWRLKLNDQGIYAAMDLASAPVDLLLTKFGVVMSRTQRDRQGWPCIGLEEQESVRKQILVSRSFGLRVEAHSEVQQVAATLCRPCLSKAP